MSEIKPVPAERFNMGYSFYDQPEMQTSETGDYVEFSAYEAKCNEVEQLKKENERLDFKFKQHLCSARSLLQKYCSQNAAQAKRIEELEAATDHLGLTPQQAADGLARYKAQVAEIESLRKQVEEIKELCAKEAEHWQKIGKNPDHACGQYIAAAIRGIKPASKNGE